MPDLDFDGELELFPTAAGGRRRPIRTGYRASLWFGETGPTGQPALHSGLVTLQEDSELAPGESADVRVAPLAWESWPHGTTRTRFELFEGGHHVGRGVLRDALLAAESQPEIRRALHATLEEWVLERFADRVIRHPRLGKRRPDLVAIFRDRSGVEHRLAGEVVARRPVVGDVQHLVALMHEVGATLGLIVGLDEPSGETWDAVVAQGGIELPGFVWTPRVRVTTTRQLAGGETELLPGHETPERLELIAG